MLDTLRHELWRLHMELPKNNLVTWTGGNVSLRDPQTGYVVIKPSGVRYEDRWSQLLTRSRLQPSSQCKSSGSQLLLTRSFYIHDLPARHSGKIAY
jgi:hypothetical protein